MKIVNILPSSNVGTLIECVCDCDHVNYVVFNETGVPMANGVLPEELSDVQDMVCSLCKQLVLGSAGLKAAQSAFQLGSALGVDYALEKFFTGWGVPQVALKAGTSGKPRIVALKKFKAPNPTWQKIKKSYNSVVSTARKAPLFVVSALRIANKFGIPDSDDTEK